MPQLRFKINTGWCQKCGRITGRDKLGNCLVCTQILAKEYKEREARNENSK